MPEKVWENQIPQFVYFPQTHERIFGKMWLSNHDDASDGEEETQRGKVTVSVSGCVQEYPTVMISTDFNIFS